MEYNIDILIAGCDTRCAHCYVDGGPGPRMSLEDYERCLDALAPAFERFGPALSFTLDNELFAHERAADILRVTAARAGANYYHHGCTTGVTLARRGDADELLALLRERGWTTVSFAVHGGEAVHNRLVANPEAMGLMVRAAERCRAAGLEVSLSLMATKAMLEDGDALLSLLDRLPHDALLPVLPDFMPSPRLRRYQRWRLNRGEMGEMRALLLACGVPEADLSGWLALPCESEVCEAVLSGAYAPALEERQTAYLHVDARLDLYRGNTGVPLERVGSLTALSPEALCEAVARTPDNYYETASIHYADIRRDLRRVRRSGEDYVYPNAVSCVIAMLDNARRAEG